VFDDAGTWSNDWAWSLPLIVLTVLAHAFGLALIREQLVLPLSAMFGRRSSFVLAPIIAPTVMLVAFLHGIEAGGWAIAYVGLKARPDSPPPCSIR
jgi:hypothetical protein